MDGGGVRASKAIHCESCSRPMGFVEGDVDPPCTFCSRRCFEKPEKDQERLEREDEAARTKAPRKKT